MPTAGSHLAGEGLAFPEKSGRPEPRHPAVLRFQIISEVADDMSAGLLIVYRKNNFPVRHQKVAGGNQIYQGTPFLCR